MMRCNRTLFPHIPPPAPTEFHAGAMLSVIASLTPYSDFNQSPRNMYQCQMAKQTMGTPAQALQARTDNKLYRLQTPQTPVTRTKRCVCVCVCGWVGCATQKGNLLGVLLAAFSQQHLVSIWAAA